MKEKNSALRMFQVLLLGGALFLNGCSSTAKSEPEDVQQSQEVIQKDKDEKDIEKKEINPEDSENDMEEDPASESSLEYVKEMKDLDPDTIPFAVGNVFLANTTDGNLQLLDAQGNQLSRSELKEATLMQSVKDDGWYIQASFVNGDSCSYFLNGASAKVDNSGGLGCFQAETLFYNPEDQQAWTLTQTDHNVVQKADLSRWNLPEYSGSVKVFFEQNADEQTRKSGDYYVLNCADSRIYGPFTGHEIFGFRPDDTGITVYTNCTDVYPAVFAISSPDGYTVISGTSSSSRTYDQAQSVAMRYVMVSDSAQKSLIGPTAGAAPIVLPADAQLTSGMAGGSLMILEQGTWKLYRNPDDEQTLVRVDSAGDFISTQNARTAGLPEDQAGSLTYQDPSAQNNTGMTDPLDEEALSAAGRKMVLTDAVNVRTGPGTSEQKVATLPAGTRLSILKTVDQGDSLWGQFEQDGQLAWICIRMGDETYLKDE